MNIEVRCASEDQLVRLLQVGVVLEEVFEARAGQHSKHFIAANDRITDDEVSDILTEAKEESAEHRYRLESLIDELDANTVPFEQIQTLVAEKYGETKPNRFNGLLHDQYHSEKSAYNFYDNLIRSIENSDTEFSVSRERVLETLRTIRREEKEGADRVKELIRGGGRSV
jgi:rubrerythrin